MPQLKRIREERALSQRDLAAMSGVAHDSIGQIERGDRKARPSTVRKLAEALGVDPSLLLAGRQSQESARQEDIQQAFEQGMERGDELVSAIFEYESNIARARSKMSSGDPQVVLESTELARRKLRKIVFGLNGIFADWYHMGGKRLTEVDADHPDKVLMKAAAEAAQEWLNFYNQCLDLLDQEIRMRRGEVTSLEDFVVQLSQGRGRDLGEVARGGKTPPMWRRK